MWLPLITGFQLLAWGLAAAEPAPVSFIRDIQPILCDTCFSCHGPDVKPRKASLRLDTPVGAYGKTATGAVAIAPAV